MTSRRTDAWEATLTEADRWRIYERLCRFNFTEVYDWLKGEFAFPRMPSRSALYRFRRHMAAEESAHRIEQALSVKADVQKQMAAVGTMDAELDYAWTQMAMQSALKGDESAGRTYLSMAMRLRDSALEREKLRLAQEAEDRAKQELELKVKDLDVKIRRLELLESNAVQAKHALESAKSTGGLSPEALERIEEAAQLL